MSRVVNETMPTKLKKSKLRGLIFFFQLLTLILLIFYNGKNMDSREILIGFIVILLVFLSNIFVGFISKGDSYLFAIASMLYSIGFVMIYRLDPSLGARHVLWFGISLGVFYFVYFFMRFMPYFEDRTMLFMLVCFLLFAVTLVFGVNLHGARNWIQIGGRSFQPSEITKLVFIFFLASYYKNEERYEKIRIKNFPIGRYFLLIVVYLFIGLFFLQKDLGSAVIFFGIYFVLLFIYEDKRSLILLNLLLIIAGMVLGYYLFDHVKIRVTTWLNPWDYMDGIGYQITQSLFGIASGGFFGTGIGLDIRISSP